MGFVTTARRPGSRAVAAGGHFLSPTLGVRICNEAGRWATAGRAPRPHGQLLGGGGRVRPPRRAGAAIALPSPGHAGPRSVPSHGGARPVPAALTPGPGLLPRVSPGHGGGGCRAWRRATAPPGPGPRAPQARGVGTRGAPGGLRKVRPPHVTGQSHGRARSAAGGWAAEASAAGSALGRPRAGGRRGEGCTCACVWRGARGMGAHRGPSVLVLSPAGAAGGQAGVPARREPAPPAPAAAAL